MINFRTQIEIKTSGFYHIWISASKMALFIIITGQFRYIACPNVPVLFGIVDFCVGTLFIFLVNDHIEGFPDPIEVHTFLVFRSLQSRIERLKIWYYPYKVWKWNHWRQGARFSG